MPSVWPGPGDVAAYSAPPADMPPRADTAPSEEVVAQRIAVGLPVDEESVQRAIANSRRSAYPLPGVYLTPEEEAEELAQDDELAERVQAVLHSAGAEVGRVSWRWRAGVRVIEVAVKTDVEHYRRLVAHEVSSDRVIVNPARYTERELLAVCDRIGEESASLAEAGIDLAAWSPSEAVVELKYFAADRDRAAAVLLDRFGAVVRPEWLGPSSVAEVPHRFGSWIADGSQLTVFYALPHNGEQPGNCTVEEHPDRVLVSLTILDQQGFKTLVGGFKPSHATVHLEAPLAGRLVIDAADGQPRPEWVGGSTNP